MEEYDSFIKARSFVSYHHIDKCCEEHSSVRSLRKKYNMFIFLNNKTDFVTTLQLETLKSRPP